MRVTQAGQLREHVALDRPTSAPDGQGGRENGWSEIVRAYAHFRPLRGGEKVVGARLAGVQPVVITVPASPATRSITAGWRLRDLRRLADVYNVRSVIIREADDFVEITAERGVAV